MKKMIGRVFVLAAALTLANGDCEAMHAQGGYQVQMKLTRLAETGYAGKRNYAKLYEWLLAGTNAGCPRSTYNLAIMYRDGLGGPQDLSMAATLFEQAWSMGYQDAQAVLSELPRGM